LAGGIHFQVSGLGNREPGAGARVQVRVRDGVLGRAWLSEPAAGVIVIRASVREWTARRAVPTLRDEVANIVDRLTSGPVGKGDVHPRETGWLAGGIR